ncbi:glycosyltransferase [Bermanella marisrubri]|uniref:Glycosyltransferase n=1 Tax=Bermanella marisrubri TaxID=207949 RepID=Q1N312_9GAMM|nr:TIGR04282 family arsenosugar biosynthesis glycosyltransferase [Bermanella marisrubri]EAT12507.1 hypothetical protein RED65_06418 [Oceanobacter sp. RED65] [Bermanella marisrubri]QIZ84933.1 glycosyltransferase [Bermanella marisrubri]
MKKALVLQFAKQPKLGHVKTRMQPVLSPEQSVKLHVKLIRHTWQQIQSLQSDQVDVRVALDSEDIHPAVDDLFTNTDRQTQLQQGSDLGERMRRAVEKGLKDYQSVLIVGSDCPAITTQSINEAMLALEYADHVFIPAEDGGYVLIGAGKVFPAIFSDMPWGTGEVMSVTRKRLDLANEKAIFLDSLWDIDRPEDYHRLIEKDEAFTV